MKNRKTLLLSQGYQLIKKISPKRAICMHFLGKVDVVEEYPETINSPTLAINIPAVVRLLHYAKTEPMKVRFSRTSVYARDGHICQYCGGSFKKANLTLDHVIPKSFGGKTNWTNIVTCCKACNTKKANKTPHQANMRLISKPKYPNPKHVCVESLGDDVPEQWKNWIF